MSDDEDRPSILFDASLTDETVAEAQQRRGRERMIAMWRAAVECVTEAAARQVADTGPVAAPGDDDEVDGHPVATPTWVFPARRAAHGN